MEKQKVFVPVDAKKELPNEDAAEIYALSKYPKSDKTQFTTTYWTQHNIAMDGFKAGVRWQKNHLVTPNKMAGEDELADKLRDAILHDFGNLIVTPCVRNCTKIALQYHQSKLEELQRLIANADGSYSHKKNTKD